MEKQLGKIQDVYFGIGGYQDCCIGIYFTLGGTGWGVNDSKTTWDPNLIKWTKTCKWTEQDRSKSYDEIIRYISDLLKKAKVKTIQELKGIPIEGIFEDFKLISWRILEEVL